MMAWSVLLQGTLGMAHEPQADFGAQGTLSHRMVLTVKSPSLPYNLQGRWLFLSSILIKMIMLL